MKVGTKSLIFGIHQFFYHPYVVYKAWKELYGKPTFKEFVCIFIHDWGYFGKPNLDGPEGSSHPELGSRIALKLLGKSYSDLCLFHSRGYASKSNVACSKLCWADKLSFAFENPKFYLFRARLSGELTELRWRMDLEGFIPLSTSDEEWFNILFEMAKQMGASQKDVEFPPLRNRRLTYGKINSNAN